MTTIEARQEAQCYIREHATEYFTKDRSGKGYICPICGSGSGVHGTGITTKDGQHFTCWAGCFTSADIFEIIGLQNNLTDFNEIFNQACEIFNIPSFTRYQERKSDNRAQTYKKEKNQSDTPTAENFTEFYKEAEKNLTQTDYHRGISLETLRRFHVGFIPQWRHPKAGQNIPTSPRLIIPIWKGGYLARDTRSNLTDTQREYAKMRVGTIRLFNQGALTQTEKPVFVVEGEIDALSIIDAGGEAVALCSVANVKKLLETVKAQPPKVGLIITLDSDKVGEGTAQKLMAGLQELNFFSYRQISIPEPYKDANEFLLHDKQKFTAWVQDNEKISFTQNTQEGDTMTQTDNSEPQNQNFDLPPSNLDYLLTNFESDLSDFQKYPEVKTGFENLDKEQGGLYPGFYVLGAVPSIGKTSFCLQMADNIAESGRKVFYVALEQNRLELVTKSLSRLTAKMNEKYSCVPVSSLNIRKGNFTKIQREAYENAIEEYKNFADDITIHTMSFTATVLDIKNSILSYVEYTGIKPVVFVDYLQIINPDTPATHVQKSANIRSDLEFVVSELKKLQSNENLTMILISSFNRANYTSGVDFSSFKESGIIEYTADVLWGMQYQAMLEDDVFDKEKGERLRRKLLDSEAGKYPRRVMLKNLKNRYGKSKYACGFIYDPRYDYFVADKRFSADFRDEMFANLGVKNESKSVH